MSYIKPQPGDILIFHDSEGSIGLGSSIHLGHEYELLRYTDEFKGYNDIALLRNLSTGETSNCVLGDTGKYKYSEYYTVKHQNYELY